MSVSKEIEFCTLFVERNKMDEEERRRKGDTDIGD